MDVYDIAIIGSGPAGLTAGIYGVRSGLKCIIFEKMAVGGIPLITAEIENYPGVLKTSGFELMSLMEKQCRELGCEIVTEDISSIEKDGDTFTLSGQQKYKAKSVIAATGSTWRKLQVPGELELTGKGVSYCATCDGPFFKNETIAVVGGGNTACEEALYLTKFAKKVYIIHRRDELRATKIIQERLKENPKIEIIWDSVVEKINGEQRVESLTLKNKKTEQLSELKISGVFIFIGLIPNSELFTNLSETDDRGFLLSNADLSTKTPGFFVAGDVRNTPLRQVVTAASDGAIAAFSAEKYLAGH
jgi:thioredoxin reductase (NADPH)